MNKKLTLAITILVVTAIACIIGGTSAARHAAATDLYNAHNAGDSATFVCLYSMSDHDVIREYERMIRDSIRWEKEWQAEQVAAVTAWNNRKK